MLDCTFFGYSIIIIFEEIFLNSFLTPDLSTGYLIRRLIRSLFLPPVVSAVWALGSRLSPPVSSVFSEPPTWTHACRARSSWTFDFPKPESRVRELWAAFVCLVLWPALWQPMRISQVGSSARQRSSETEDTHKAQLNANVWKCSEHLI